MATNNTSEHKAFLLAAGLGTRLKPLTDVTPKPMLPIAGKPLLLYQILLLKKYGVKEIAMNLYHLPDQITDFFGDGSKFGVKIHYIPEKELSGTAGPIKKLATFFDHPFFVIYGDDLTNIDLEKFKNFHQEKKGMVSVALYQEEHPESKGIVHLDSQKRIVNFKEKPKPEEIDTNLANAGIYICNPAILEHIPDNTFYDFAKDVFPDLLAKNIRMYGYEMNDYLLDIGNPEAYKKAQSDAPRVLGDL